MARTMSMIYNYSKMNRMVRLTHKPTGITAEASEHRSQHSNRDSAYAMLKGKLALGQTHPLPLRACYDFPDGEPWPDDITTHREPA